jgi:hypothetical protein
LILGLFKHAFSNVLLAKLLNVPHVLHGAGESEILLMNLTEIREQLEEEFE